MQTLQELGESVATRRKLQGLKQHEMAALAGITPESLSRYERGRSAEFGARKLLAVLALLGALRQERAQSRAGRAPSATDKGSR